MDRTERFYKIELLLRNRGCVPFEALIEELGVSRATLKRDLQYLRDRLSAPIVEGLAPAPDLDRQPLRVLGVDPIAEAPFRNYLANTSLNAPGLSRFYTEPTAVIASQVLADQYQLKIGDSIRLQIGAGFKEVTIIG